VERRGVGMGRAVNLAQSLLSPIRLLRSFWGQGVPKSPHSPPNLFRDTILCILVPKLSLLIGEPNWR